MQFSKMHGLGNDFVLIDAITQNIDFSSEIICYLSDRHKGIGFDQLLMVEAPYNPHDDFHYRIFNANGSEVAQCGNGARCLAIFVRLKKLTNKRYIKLSTRMSNIALSVLDNEEICVNMGVPEFMPTKLLFNSNFISKIRIYELVYVGNLHCILQVENVNSIEVALLSSILKQHKDVPKQANIGFMQIINCEYIRLRVYEYGVGETQACGSGACAAVAIGIKQKLLKNNVNVDLLGGVLKIYWNGLGHPIFMTGPATHVYDGVINLSTDTKSKSKFK